MSALFPAVEGSSPGHGVVVVARRASASDVGLPGSAYPPAPAGSCHNDDLAEHKDVEKFHSLSDVFTGHVHRPRSERPSIGTRKPEIGPAQ
jgi:hypothetical protein